MTLADRVAVLDKGRFLQVSPPAEIYDQPNCATVAHFIGHSAIIPVHCQGGIARLDDQQITPSNPSCPDGPAMRDASIILRENPRRAASSITMPDPEYNGWVDPNSGAIPSNCITGMSNLIALCNKLL
jgi:ABC-type sulfate/molybdate transport systems ATPase subunit